MYAILDRDGAAVVDPGLPGGGTWRVIQERLKQAGLKVKDVHTVIVTHSHPDHFGGANRFVREAGARVVGHHRFSFGPFGSTEPEVSVDDLAAHHRHAHGVQEDTAHDERLPEALESAIDEANEILERSRTSGKTPWGSKRDLVPAWRRLRFRVMNAIGRTWIPNITCLLYTSDAADE